MSAYPGHADPHHARGNSLFEERPIFTAIAVGVGSLLPHLFLPPQASLGFAAVLIALIAYFAERKARAILKALVVVLLVKAAASPHTPLPAYVAVSFQGLAGALLFGLLPSIRLGANANGSAMLARIASTTGPRLSVTSSPFAKSVAVRCSGTRMSSTRASPNAARSRFMINRSSRSPKRSASNFISFGAMARIMPALSRWLVTSRVHSARAIAAISPASRPVAIAAA